MCREGTATADSASDVVGPLTQIPFIRKMTASANRIISTYDQIRTGSKFPIHQGKEGHWIKAKGMDVFVARNQSIKQALENQCGCSKLGSVGKISKEKADYHKTDSTTKNCHTCRFFHEKTGYCEVVDGNIEPYYVSDLWQPKST